MKPIDMFGDFDEVKLCPQCERNLPVNKDFWYFHKSGRHKGRGQPRCKSCMKLRSSLQYAQRDPVSYRVSQERQQIKNRDKRRLQARQRRAKNRTAYNKYQRQYHRGYYKTEELRQQAAYRTRSRRMRKVINGGSHTPLQIQQLLSIQERKCAYCKCDVTNSYHIDHIEPISKGGSNGIYNLVITCPTCNLSKGNKDLDAWLIRAFINKREFLIWLKDVQSQLLYDTD